MHEVLRLFTTYVAAVTACLAIRFRALYQDQSMGNTCGSTVIKISQQVNKESGLYSNNKLLAKSRHAVLPVKQTFPITHIASCTDHLAWNYFFYFFFIILHFDFFNEERVISLFLHLRTHISLQYSNLVQIGIIFQPRQVKAQEDEVSQHFI